MIGRADIEGSKSNVAMNAWLPQASYPCGNFSDTSSFKFRRTKGSIGHAFTVRIRTGNQNQTSFYPFVPHEISVLVEPNSPPGNVFRPDRPTEADLGTKKRGSAPPPIHGIIGLESSSTGSSFPVDSAKPVPLVVVSLDIGFPLSVPVLSRLFDAQGRGPEGPVPNPSPDRHATTRSRRGSSSSSPPTADGFRTGTPVPSPQSQSFSRGYGSILPTSLAYIVPSTRGCSPWRPDAVMSTIGHGRHSVLRIFKGRWGRTGHHATCGALPAAGPYLWLSRFQVGHRNPASGSSRIASSAYQKWPTWSSRFRGTAQQSSRTNSHVGSNYPEGNFGGNQLLDGIVHHLSGPDRYALTRTLHRRSGSAGGATHKGIPPISFLTPYGFTHLLTRTHPGLGPPSQSASINVSSRSADRLGPFHIRPRHIAGPHPLPSRQFQALFDSLFKVLFIFPSRYLFTIGLSPVFSLGRNLPPDWGCIPKQPDSPIAPRDATGSGHNGALTLFGAPFQGTWTRSATEDASPDYN
ncbi:uncharacterized protein HKW66_Vig0080040 [Vigna angularis]|uniref:Senescence-associated protein n=1 Tax=Phaseolus angularis TaxID=3914 RepID=A0A8T0KIN3_PHAAN|nr:uncharacterized protein HKW66_Vig0080040 [Vigna angularis]